VRADEEGKRKLSLLLDPRGTARHGTVRPNRLMQLCPEASSFSKLSPLLGNSRKKEQDKQA
jgi:hypothetical protein